MGIDYRSLEAWREGIGLENFYHKTMGAGNICDCWSKLGPREQIYRIVGASLDPGSKYMELLEPAWTQGANMLDYWSQLCTKGENPKYVNEGECKMEGKKKYKIELMDE